MDNRSRFLYRSVGVKWGRKSGAQPRAGHRGAKRSSDEGTGKSVPSLERKRDGGASGPEVSGPTCQEKPLNAKDPTGRSYRKPTQVDE